MAEFAKSPHYDHICDIRDRREPYEVFSRGMCFIIIELGKFDRQMGGLLDLKEDWCYLLKNADKMAKEEVENLASRGKHMAEAVKKLWNLSQEEGLRELLVAEEKKRKDQATKEWYAREEGHKEGRKEGIEEERKKMALSMLKDGFNTEVIEKHTGLSKREIEVLSKA